MTKIDLERLKRFDRETLTELDDMIKRNIRREAENKARELAEKLAKKKKKKKRRMQQNKD
ncbi:MAG: hypothetical protein ABFE07_09115 [Armatimonadia bacterium]